MRVELVPAPIREPDERHANRLALVSGNERACVDQADEERRGRDRFGAFTFADNLHAGLPGEKCRGSVCEKGPVSVWRRRLVIRFR